MLRHSCGLANDGVDRRTIQGYLGHRSIQHTVRYTELAFRHYLAILVVFAHAAASRFIFYGALNVSLSLLLRDDH